MKTVLVTMLFLSCLFLTSCNLISDKKSNKDQAFSAANNEEPLKISGILHPCQWSYRVEQSVPGEAILISTAKIDPKWHLYSQHISDKGSPTVFTYVPLSDYKLEGGTEEGVSQKEYDQYLKIEILYFEREAEFRQKIKVLSKQNFTITGTITHTVCLTQCVTSEDDFSFLVKGNPEEE